MEPGSCAKVLPQGRQYRQQHRREVYHDLDDDDVYTGQAATQLAGVWLGSVGPGPSVTTANPWSSAGERVAFFHDGSEVWSLV